MGPKTVKKCCGTCSFYENREPGDPEDAWLCELEPDCRPDYEEVCEEWRPRYSWMKGR